MRYRSVPDLPKPVVDDLEAVYELGRALHPEMVSFTDWLQELLLSASRAVRKAYEAELAGRNGQP